MRITIITSTLNCAASLAATAASIREQTHLEVQWVVADGASSDGTLEVIGRNADIISHWFSEADGGIYDAWNKACGFINGEWVLFLGAGDLLANPETLAHMASLLHGLPANTAIAYGNVYQLNEGRLLYRYGRVDLQRWELHRPALPAHQGVFQRAELLTRRSPFDTSYRIAADSKFLIHTLRNRLSIYVDLDICHMEPAGISADPRHALTMMREAFRLQHELGYRLPPLRRAWFVCRSYAKHYVFRHLGVRSTSAMVMARRRMADLIGR
jgi:glycosyltransferase involved in cell wall biosynthesis